MEAEFLSLGLDIIGLGVFNYDFGSITSESPVIKAVYGVLKEAEHRSTFYLPYWNVALLRWLVPRQRKFAQDLQVINATLDGLISEAIASRTEEDAEALQQRDYSRVRDPSLLRFLVDARGEDATAKQLRDDLMTMLIAGHETTAAVLTWTLYCLAQHPEEAQLLREEVDSVLADGRDPGIDDVRSLPRVRAALAESLRLYPQPPLLIRRALAPDTLPAGLNGAPEGYPIGKGADLFISVWNLHHSPHLWKDPEAFRPGRFSEQFSNPAFNGEWAGYRPDSSPGAMYPNEITSDFAFLPFGGGARKCVGDQFAFFEAVIALAMLLRRFDFELAVKPEEVGMATGATIHTRDGLKMRVSRRTGGGGSVGAAAAEAAAAAAPAAR
jgi:cytochrome P450